MKARAQSAGARSAAFAAAFPSLPTSSRSPLMTQQDLTASLSTMDLGRSQSQPSLGSLLRPKLSYAEAVTCSSASRPSASPLPLYRPAPPPVHLGSERKQKSATD